jgi:FdhD protein
MNTSDDVATTTDASTCPYVVETIQGAQRVAERADDVAVEAPLEVRFAGKPTTVLMRTPGHDEELVLGFLFAEGMIKTAAEVAALVRPTDLAESDLGNVIDVHFAGGGRRAGPDRLFLSSASCGACGKRTIASLAIDAKRLESRMAVDRSMLGMLPGRLRDAQPVFAVTGGVHASGLFTRDGRLVALREDVGRHNALDKLIGWALAEGRLPLDEHIVMLSGRVSYELVQKAVMASAPLLAAVGAPSSLAIDLAREFNLTLVGFLRESSMNVYHGADRIRD